jgi:hypothetical protein
MTPAVIALFVLCAVLAVQTPIWLAFTQNAGVALKKQDELIACLRALIAHDAAIHADTFRLLRDPRARAKNVRHDAWLAELEMVEETWRAQ